MSLCFNVIVGDVFDCILDVFFVLVLVIGRRFILEEILVPSVALGACLWQIETDRDISPERVEDCGGEHLPRWISRNTCTVLTGLALVDAYGVVPAQLVIDRELGAINHFKQLTLDFVA